MDPSPPPPPPPLLSYLLPAHTCSRLLCTWPPLPPAGGQQEVQGQGQEGPGTYEQGGWMDLLRLALLLPSLSLPPYNLSIWGRGPYLTKWPRPWPTASSLRGPRALQQILLNSPVPALSTPFRALISGVLAADWRQQDRAGNHPTYPQRCAEVRQKMTGWCRAILVLQGQGLGPASCQIEWGRGLWLCILP